jgi:hypothetical protein
MSTPAQPDETAAAMVQLDPPWRQAVQDALQAFTYGDTIPMEWLDKAFDIQYPKTGTREDYKAISFQFLTAMDRFREDLLTKHKMALRNVRGVGYEIIPPGEHAIMARAQFLALMRKAFDVAESLLENTDFGRLTQEEIQRSRTEEAKIATIKALSRKTMRAPAPGRIDNLPKPK